MYPPLWTQCLRAYCHWFPINRGKSRIAKWAFKHMPPLKEPFTASIYDQIRIELWPWLWGDFCSYVLGSPEIYHLTYFRSRLQESSVVFDIGAYIGTYTFVASQTARKGKVYAFEPDPRSAERLQRSVQISNIDNIQIVQAALGDHTGELPFVLAAYPPQSSLSNDSASGSDIQSISVQLESLDNYCQAQDITHVDYLKIDVEGAELQVLRGGANMIRTSRPEMIIELHETMAPSLGYTTQDVIEYLQGLNYVLYQVLPGIRQPHLVPFDYRSGSGASRHIVVALPA
jgi:FkbM family methyltransferase